jgi:class 3 adenylate cyclase
MAVFQNIAAADFIALGDHINIVARLACIAGPGEVLVSEATYKAVHLLIQIYTKMHLWNISRYIASSRHIH